MLGKEIATTLGISQKTVEFHKYKMMRKAGVKSVVEPVRYAIREKIVSP
jgi:DNA-binding CsgD family transcriptional regulator